MKSQLERQVEGVLAGLDFGVPAGQKLSVVQGDTIRMHVAFEYKGPAKTYTLRCVIGNRTAVGVFDEIAYQRGSLNLPASDIFKTHSFYADINTSPISPGANYDVYAKIEEFASQTITTLLDVIDVLSPTGAFQNFRITEYGKV